MQNGNFLTSETELTLPQSGSLVKLDGAFITAKANENLPKNSLVYFVPNTTDRVGLASGVYPDVETKTPIGFVQVATYQNEPVNLITSGRLVQDELWNWSVADIGKPVYCDSTGGMTLARSGEKTLRVGTVFSTKSVMLTFDWETQPTSVAGEVVNVNGVEPIFISGSAIAPNVNVRMVSGTNAGVLSSDQFNDIQTAIAEIPNKSNIGHTHAMAEVVGLQAALSNKAEVSHTHVAADITDLQPLLDAKSDVGHGHSMGEITGLLTALAGKANVSHTHAIAGVVGLQDALDAKSSVGHVHEISDTNGLQVALDSKSDVGHVHEISDTNGLQVALDSKSDVGHGHTIAAISGLQSELDGKAPVSHTHLISDVQGLASALTSKSDVDHQHTISDTAGLQTALDSKSEVGHQHAIGEITGLQIVLDNKSNINHTHTLASLTDVDVAGAVAGQFLKFDGTNWSPALPAGGTGTTIVGLSEIAFGNTTNGEITSYSNFTYNRVNNAFYVNVPTVSNEQSEIIIRSGDNGYSYGHAELLMSTSFGVGSSDIRFTAGNANLDASTISWPGATPDIRGGSIYLSAGDGQANDNIGGSIFLYAGNSTGTKKGGNVLIYGGSAASSELGGDILISGSAVHIDSANGSLQLANNGSVHISGNPGNAGEVFTSNGPGLPASWQPVSGGSGGFSPPGIGFIVVDTSMQIRALTDAGWPAIPVSFNGEPHLLEVGDPGTVFTAQAPGMPPAWESPPSGPLGQSFTFTANTSGDRPADGVTRFTGWSNINTYAVNDNIYTADEKIYIIADPAYTWKVNVQTVITPYDSTTSTYGLPIGAVKYGVEIDVASGGSLVGDFMSSHVMSIPDAETANLTERLSWTDTFVVRSNGHGDMRILVGSYMLAVPQTATSIEFETVLNITITPIGPSGIGV
jgi:hypothetical protein